MSSYYLQEVEVHKDGSEHREVIGIHIPTGMDVNLPKEIDVFNTCYEAFKSGKYDLEGDFADFFKDYPDVAKTDLMIAKSILLDEGEFIEEFNTDDIMDFITEKYPDIILEYDSHEADGFFTANVLGCLLEKLTNLSNEELIASRTDLQEDVKSCLAAVERMNKDHFTCDEGSDED